MTDRSAEIAEFFMHTVGWSFAEIDAEIARRFPNATDDEISRGARVAAELLRAEAAEHHAEADALRAEVRRRRAPP